MNLKRVHQRPMNRCFKLVTYLIQAVMVSTSCSTFIDGFKGKRFEIDEPDLLIERQPASNLSDRNGFAFHKLIASTDSAAQPNYRDDYHHHHHIN